MERLIGSIYRKCLNDVIVLNERHLTRILHCYIDDDHDWRTVGHVTIRSRPDRPSRYLKSPVTP